MSGYIPVSELKDKLWQELAVKTALVTDGVNITKEVLNFIKPGTRVQEQVHCLFEMDFENHDFELPSGFDLPFGLTVPFRWNPAASHTVVLDGDRTILVNKGEQLGEVHFHKRPQYYSSLTSDGKDMSTIGAYYQHRSLFIVYSNECSYKGTACSAISTTPKIPTPKKRGFSGRLPVKSAKRQPKPSG